MPGSLADLFSTRLHASGSNQPLYIPTHTAGLAAQDIRLISYRNNVRKGTSDALQPDIARFFSPGEIGVSIKHRCFTPNEKPLERIKFQCDHAQLVLGIDLPQGPGVITLNIPQDYHKQFVKGKVRLRGLFGYKNSPMIFFKLRFPANMPGELVWQYLNNICSWALMTNGYAAFPEADNYNGADPVTAITLKKIDHFGRQLIKAMAGNRSAIKWLQKTRNQLYCSEFIYLALNLGLYFPLNEAYMGNKLFAKFAATVQHPGFLLPNKSVYLRQSRIAVASPDLKPFPYPNTSEMPHRGGYRNPFESRLFIKPYTLADMLLEYLMHYFPGDDVGNSLLASRRIEVLRQIFPAVQALLQLTRSGSSRHRHIRQFDRITKALLEIFGREDRSELLWEMAADYLEELNKLPDLLHIPVKHYIPPHAFLTAATRSLKLADATDRLGWQYIGHGIHESLLLPIR